METYFSLLSGSESLPLSCLDGDGGSFFDFCCLPSSSERDFGVSLSLVLFSFSCFVDFSGFDFSATFFSVLTSLLKIEVILYDRRNSTIYIQLQLSFEIHS